MYVAVAPAATGFGLTVLFTCISTQQMVVMVSLIKRPVITGVLQLVAPQVKAMLCVAYKSNLLKPQPALLAARSIVNFILSPGATVLGILQRNKLPFCTGAVGFGVLRIPTKLPAT